jgi:V8-like Glu-specific endopeptidase
VARNHPKERTTLGGVLRPDATQTLPGFCGKHVEMMDDKTISGDRKLLSNYKKAGRRVTPRVANRSRRTARESGFIDDDDRVRVFKPHLYPFSTICALRSYFPSPNLGGRPIAGTGVLVGPRLLLTAGHNVYDEAYGGAVNWVEVYSGLNGEFEGPNTRSVVAEKWATTNNWLQQGLETFDYGALLLPTDLGNDVGWMAVEARADGDLKGLAINNASYPVGWPKQAREEGYQPDEATTMWFDYGNVTKLNDFTLYYTEIFTAEGSSGSPIYAFLDGQNDPYRIVGVHNYGGTFANQATRISQIAFEDIAFWREKSEALKPGE